MSFTQNLSLPILTPGLGGHVPHNKALIILDVILGGSVLGWQNDAPATPSQYDAYVIKVPTAGNTWDDHDGELAIFFNGDWIYIEPHHGLRVWSSSDNIQLLYGSSGWVTTGAGVAHYAGRLSAGNQTSTSATFAGIAFTTDLLEPALAYTHPNSGANEQVLILSAGTYLVELSCEVQGAGGAVEAEFGIGRNSVTSAEAGSTRRLSIASGAYGNVHASVVVTAAALDYVAPIFRRISGAGTVTVTNDRMMFRVTKLNP